MCGNGVDDMKLAYDCIVYACCYSYKISFLSPSPLIPGHSRSSTFDTSNDRLLTSEVSELQAKLQALVRENHELRQEIAKIPGLDASRIRSKRNVRVPDIPCAYLCIYCMWSVLYKVVLLVH